MQMPSERIITLALQSEGQNVRFDALLHAVHQRVSLTGLDRVTMEEVAEEAHVARATVYRWFGSREGMLRAYLTRHSLPMINLGRQIASGPADLKSRLEAVIKHMVDDVNSAPLFKREFARGLSPGTEAAVRYATGCIVDLVIVPMLRSAAAENYWKAPAPEDELASWLSDQILYLLKMCAAKDLDIGRLVRTYLMPVLGLDPIGVEGNIEKQI